MTKTQIALMIVDKLWEDKLSARLKIEQAADLAKKNSKKNLIAIAENGNIKIN